MKKRFLAFLLAVCVAVSMLVLPASAVGSNAAVQTATALGGLTAEQAGSLGAPLTRGQAARLLTAFSAYRDTTTAQGRTGRLYSDVDSDSPYAVYIRTAVQNGWMTGYSDGSFRPDNTVTLEEACTMALRLLGYDVAKLGGTFPTAQLSKASALGLRNEINARQGETLTLELDPGHDRQLHAGRPGCASVLVRILPYLQLYVAALRRHLPAADPGLQLLLCGHPVQPC